MNTRFWKCQFEKHRIPALLILFFAGLLLRILCASPGFSAPESFFFRTDTASYLNPARALLEDFAFHTSPGSGIAALHRTPGYPLFLAFQLFAGRGSILFCVFSSILLSALTPLILYFAAKELLPHRYALLASWLFALNPTAIAHAPLFLSDTLFTFTAAFTLLFFLRFLRTGEVLFLLLCSGAASFGVLVRPLNLFWIFPCLFVGAFVKGIPRREKLFSGVLALIIFLLMPGAWILRNHANGAGWRIDIVSSGTAMHNRSALESRLLNLPGETLRARYEEEAREEFRRFPERYRTLDARLSYHERKLAETVKKYPFRYFALHFRALTLVPDAPTFFENLGITKTGRGTFDVINRKGFWEGVRFYFGNNWKELFLLSPLLLVAGVTVTGALGGGILALLFWKKRWMTVLLFLLFAEYYLFLTGPVAMPRYQLPALLFLTILAAGFFRDASAFWRRRFFLRKEEPPAL